MSLPHGRQHRAVTSLVKTPAHSQDVSVLQKRSSKDLLLFDHQKQCQSCCRNLSSEFQGYLTGGFGQLCGERGQIATRTTFLLTAPLFFTFLTSNFPTLFVFLNFILWSGSFLKIPSGKRKISKKPPKRLSSYSWHLHSFGNRAETWYTASTYPSAKYVATEFLISL